MRKYPLRAMVHKSFLISWAKKHLSLFLGVTIKSLAVYIMRVCVCHSFSTRNIYATINHFDSSCTYYIPDRRKLGADTLAISLWGGEKNLGAQCTDWQTKMHWLANQLSQCVSEIFCAVCVCVFTFAYEGQKNFPTTFLLQLKLNFVLLGK